MNRLICSVMLMTLVGGMPRLVLPMARASVHATAPTHPPCDSRTVRTMLPRQGTREVQRRMKLLIGCAEARFPVKGGLRRALCIARRESGLWPWARNPAGYWGTYQVGLATWRSWWRAYPRVRRWIRRAYTGTASQVRLDPYAGVVLSLRAMHDSEAPWAGGRYSC